LQAFQPLTLSWAGAGELKTLIKAEWRGGLPLVTGSALLCGFYLNELLLKLLPREDPHPRLFDAYESALSRLANGADQAPVLRQFELKLLAELGYALPLTHEADTGRPVDPAERYYYAFERGPRTTVAEPGRRYPQVRGATLLALAQQDYSAPEAAAEAKRLMREVLDYYLEQRTLVSRRVVRDLQVLEGAESGERAGNTDHDCAPMSRIRSGLPSRRTWVAPTGSRCICARIGVTFRIRTSGGCASSCTSSSTWKWPRPTRWSASPAP
jgi:DNA repair protein RecO (recombination protein O)